MKKLFTIPVILVSFFGQAQITSAEKIPPSVTVGKIAPLGAFIAQLSYYVYPENDTSYIFTFDDKKYTQLKRNETVIFSGKGGTFEQFYTVLKSAFLEENKNNKDFVLTFKLGQDDVMVGSSKSFGTPLVRFSKGTAYTLLTEKQIDKLFGHN